MPKLIKDGELIDNNWLLIEKGSSVEEINTNGDVKSLVPFSLWLENKERISQQTGQYWDLV